MTVSILSFLVAWSQVSNLLIGNHSAVVLIATHTSLLFSVVCAAIASIGFSNIPLIWRHYKRELLLASGIAALFYLFLLLVYMLWQPLAQVVLVAVKALLAGSGLHPIILAPTTLLFDKFGISIAQYCSGIESIALFSGLYIIVGLLDWERLNKQSYLMVFPFALILLSLLNVLRVYGLILAGYYINPVIAFSLFHTYAGTIFFIVYSAAFWSIAYGRLLRKDNQGLGADTP
jgi:exosortase/archaeosortase family protein